MYVELAHEATQDNAVGRLESVQINTSSSHQKTGRKHMTSAALEPMLENT